MAVRNGILLLIAVLLILSCPIQVSAVEDEDGKYAPTEDYQGWAKAKVATQKEEPVKYIVPAILRKKYGKLILNAAASSISGYDNNVNLNRYDQDGSFFNQNNLSIHGKYPIVKDKLYLKSGYDFTWIKYFKFSDPDLVDNVLSAGIETKLPKDLTWEVGYAADFVGFPRDKISRYTMNLLETSLKQDVTGWLYHQIGYEFFHKHYPDWKTSNNNGELLERDRGDARNTVSHQVGVYVGDKTFVKLDNRFYRNTSNELFLQFYDYKAFKTRTSLTHILTNKLYGSANFSYQYKAYDKRSVAGKEFDQRDHLVTCGTSIFYDIIPSVSLGVSFDLMDNRSNENQQKYEDCIISSGVYAVF
ncbi:MAG: hypothetical protein ABH875_00750 [Candidatus Omnitrophota bacterium]